MIQDFSSQFSSFCPYMKDLSLFSKYPVYIKLYVYMCMCTITSYRRHDSFLRFHIATVVVCETRVETSDNDLTELKRGIGSVNSYANQLGKNNNASLKRDKITKNIINAPKSRNSKNLSSVVPD